MKIAATYENGNIFQHFGRTENFKVYTVENGEVVGAVVMNSNGIGHEALAGLLAENDISVLICGGIGSGATAALSEAGVSVFSGAEGDADAAVQAFLRGELENAGINCDHHDHEEVEEEGCGGGCGGCGGGCGGCGGGCGGGRQPLFEGTNVGKTLRVHYQGTFNDGTQFDSSYDRGEPLEFVCGMGMMIMGFDKACAEMKVGDIVNVHLMPEEAYGERDPQAVMTLNIADLPGSENLQVGQGVYLTNMYGQQFPVTVTDRTEENITFDANHSMAGKELNFKIEMVSIED